MLSSERGRIKIPDLDDRSWKDLVEEMRALIPRYAPQWTDHNPSDLGITLIELFAWLVEGLIYRLNRVPEKNYIAFLNLLGITRDPATPARAFLTFTAGPEVVNFPEGFVEVPRRTQAQTQGTETEPPVVFETDEAVKVLPVNLRTALLVKGETYTNVSTSFTAPPAEGLMVEVLPGQPVQLCLGFDKKTEKTIRLCIQVNRPVQSMPPPVTGPPVTGPQVAVAWVYSTGALPPADWPLMVNPERDQPGPAARVVDETEGLRHAGDALLTLPASWASQTPTLPSPAPPGPPPPSWSSHHATPTDTVTDPFFWIGIRMTNRHTAPVTVGLRQILFNAATAHNALTIPGALATPPAPELLGQSSGKPFQVFALKYRPLFKRPDSDTPYDHLEVKVGGKTWTQVDDLPKGAGECYRLDPVAGEVSFGNVASTGGQGNGSIPPTGSRITATYRYVAGGVSGNVGAGRISTLRARVDGIFGVTNVAASFGASDEEPIADTMRRAPDLLRNRYRAVTAEDYEYLAREATTDVAIARCLAPRVHDANSDPPGSWVKDDPWRFAGIDRSPGNVTVIVVPDLGLTEHRPKPDKELLDEVRSYLYERRALTAHLHVTEPRYLQTHTKVKAWLWKKATHEETDALKEEVKAEIEKRIETFFHPIHGGPRTSAQLDARGWQVLDGTGWQVGEHVFVADLYKAILPPKDIGYIEVVKVDANLDENPRPPERPFTLAVEGEVVRLTDYELVCFGSCEVELDEIAPS